MQLQLELANNELFIADESQCDFLAEFFKAQLTDIHLKLVRDLSFISQLAHYKDGMQISHVSYLQANRYQLHFVYTWHIFQGCIGMDETGEMKDKAAFSVSDSGKVKVDLSAFEAQSTADEL